MRCCTTRRTSVLVALLGGLTLTVPAVPVSASGQAPAQGQLWISTYNGPTDGVDTANAVGVAPDGSTVFVTGSTEVGVHSTQDYGTVAYDAATGAARWRALYDGSGGNDTAYALAVSPDGSAVFVTGTSVGDGSDDDYATVAYDATTGDELWAARYTSPSRREDTAVAVGVSPDSSMVFVTGFSARPDNSKRDYATVAYDAVGGQQLWAARYGRPEAEDYAYALQVSRDGSRVFVTGQAGYDMGTVAYDAATGTALWATRYDSHDSDAAYAIGISPDGSSVFVTGYGGPDYATIAYDAATGERQWLTTFNGPRDQSDGGLALAVSPDGSAVFVTGTSTQLENSLDSDFATLAYDASTGHQLWSARFTGPGRHDDIPTAIQVAPDGSGVFVTGWTLDARRGGNYDFATVAYDAATGANLWVERLHTAFDDVATDMAVSPDGSALFVTGRVDRGVDFGTVAYST
jgi:WD40 repeat protein